MTEWICMTLLIFPHITWSTTGVNTIKVVNTSTCNHDWSLNILAYSFPTGNLICLYERGIPFKWSWYLNNILFNCNFIASIGFIECIGCNATFNKTFISLKQFKLLLFMVVIIIVLVLFVVMLILFVILL